MRERYPQATVTAPYDGGTVYGWNEDGATRIRIVGALTAATRPAMQTVAQALEEDRRGLHWSRLMLERLDEVRAQAQAWRRAKA